MVPTSPTVVPLVVADATVTVSLSQVQKWRRCEQAWTYQYIDGLQRIEGQAPLELGSAFHAYLARYYSGLQQGVAKTAAHTEARSNALAEWQPQFQALAVVSAAVGGEEASEELLRLAETMEYLIDRYYRIRGAEDADRYDVVVIEKELRVKLEAGLDSLGFADLILRERSSGRKLLVEHKTTKSIPSREARLLDIQTVLYTAKIGALMGVTIDAVLWNQIRTSAPAVPTRRKDGTISRAMIDTTWPVYRQAVVDAGLNVDDYGDVATKLVERETQTWFPRLEIPVSKGTDIVLRDYVTSARQIRRARELEKEGHWQPIRNLERGCNWCAFNKLCLAALDGSPTERVVHEFYTTRAQRKAAG